MSNQDSFFRIFRVLNTVQSFIFKVHLVNLLLFSVSAATRLSYHSRLHLSTTFLFSFLKMCIIFLKMFAVLRQ